MFYLKQFYYSLIQNKLNGISFVLMTFLFVFALFNRPLIKNTLDHRSNVKQLTYFKALLGSDTNIDVITRKMKDLPGVHSVNVNKKIVLNKSDVAELKAISTGELLNNFVNEDYSSIKIVLEDNLKIQTQSLIREYLGRLVGSDTLTLTGIRTPAENKSSKKLKYNYLNNIDLIVIGILALFWLIASFNYTQKMIEYSAILEKFQRREFISVKLYFTGMLFFVSLALGYAAIIDAHDLMVEIIILLGVFSIGIAYASKNYFFKKLL